MIPRSRRAIIRDVAASLTTAIIVMNVTSAFQIKYALTQSMRMTASQRPVTSSLFEKGYKHVGDLNDCSLQLDEIKNLLTERTKARRARNFQKADNILKQLTDEGIFVDDKMKIYRIDGDSEFHDSTGGSFSVDTVSYTKAPNSRYIDEEEEEKIQIKLEQRAQSRLNRRFDEADEIRDELRYLYQAEINDQDLTWAVVSEDLFLKNEYTFGGKRIRNVPDEIFCRISDLLKQRVDARRRKDFSMADIILKDLTTMYGVRVDDKRKLWHFDGSTRTKSSTAPLESEEIKVSPRTRKEQEDILPSDWSEVSTDISMSVVSAPDGVITPEGEDNLIPNGVSIVENPLDSISMIEKEDITTSEWSEVSADINTSVVSLPDGLTFPEGEDNPIPNGVSIVENPLDNISIIEDSISNTSSNTANSVKDNESNRATLEVLTVPLLKEKLRNSNLPVSGRKAVLIDRLLGLS